MTSVTRIGILGGTFDPVWEDSFQQAFDPKVDRIAPGADVDGDGHGDGGMLKYSGGEHVVLGGTEGNDRLIGGRYDDYFHGSGGDDWIEGGGGDDHLYGDAGNDSLYGGDGADRLEAGDGNDVIVGARGDRIIDGGAGNDIASLQFEASRANPELLDRRQPRRHGAARGH